jgi:hypothetical protein
MLSDGDLDGYRSHFDALLGESCVIERTQATSDGMGGSTSSWIAAGTALCNVAPIKRTGGDGFLVGDQLQEPADRVITFPAETDVRTGDQLSIGGRTYQVSELREPRTYEFVRRVEARIV